MRTARPVIVGVLVVAAQAACLRAAPENPAAEKRNACVIASEQGQLNWAPATSPRIDPNFTSHWVRLSSAPECDALLPPPVPPRFSWGPPDGGAACWPSTPDEHGDVAIIVNDITRNYAVVLPADGSPGEISTELRDDAGAIDDLLVSLAPQATGFLLETLTYRFDAGAALTPLTAAGCPDAQTTTTVDSMVGDVDGYRVVPNPRGGYVEARVAPRPNGFAMYDIDTRYLDSALRPLGNWQPAVSFYQNSDWYFGVDQQGLALVLSASRPPGEHWVPLVGRQFSGRWMGPSGPVTDLFTPPVPVLTAPDGDQSFAYWDLMLPMPTGGFALYESPVTPAGGGTISPTGWYGYYPSGGSTLEPAPRWLRAYPGTLHLLAGGKAFASLATDLATCSRTVQLVAPTGVSCFSLTLDTESCTSRADGLPDTIAPDGTLIIEDEPGSCVVQWWPGLAHVGD